MKARDLKPGDCIMARGKAILVVAITEVPEMSSRMLWYEEIGRGEKLALGADEEVELAQPSDT